MTDAFATIVYPTLRHVVDFQRGLDEADQPSLAILRGQILELLEKADQKAGTTAQLANDWEMAKHAIVYWVDEILIGSRWQHAEEWRQHILEWDFYRERLRADRFYEKAAEASQFVGTDPLEVFLICVALGFRGKYVENAASLQKWTDRVYGRVVAGSSQPDRFLPDEPRDPDRGPLRPLPGKSLLLQASVLVSVSAMLTLAAFIVISRFYALN